VLTVREPGLLATVQDQGRVGHAALGVTRSGAADRAALRLGNRLVGNAEAAAGVEVTFGGFAVRADDAATVAVTGATGEVRVDGRAVPHGEPLYLRQGAVLEIGRPVLGLRTYLAVQGGIDVPPELGSRSTDTLSGLGPAPLHAGTGLPIGTRTGEPAHVEADNPLPVASAELRVVLGPRDDWFTDTAVRDLLTATWRVSSRADRVGLRLEGPPLERSRDDELPSEGCIRGALQVSAEGGPVLFGPDHPTTGGYPVAAVVLDADCDLAAQLRPGDSVRFTRR